MALGDLSDECLVVDLDKNVVSPGVNMKPIPSLPKFVYQRLLSKVESSAGHVHREVRSLRPRDNNSEGGVHLPPELKDVADAMWESRLCLFDEAFMLMFTPEERRKNWLNGDDGSGAGGGLAGSNNVDPILLMFSERQGNLLRAQSQWDAVQEAFVDVNCFLLQKYRKFLVFPSKHNEGSYGGAGFRSQEFLAAQRVDARDFLEEMVGGQMFDEFITKRLYGSGEADISFFDGAVDRYVRNNGLVANVSGFVRQTSTGGEGGGMPPVGKNLRNMFGGGLSSTVNNERDPPLLQSARVKRELKTIVPPEPGGLDLPDDILLEGISNGVVVLVNTRKEADDVGVVSAHDDTDDDAISVTSASTATSVSTAASKAKQTAGRVYYHYPIFPERLDPKLFGKPRGLSSAVRAEYDRQRENVGKFRRTKSSEIDEDDIGTEGGASSARSMAVTGQKGPVEKPATAEVTTFTVFFMTFTAVVGKDLMAVDNDSLDQLDSKAIVSTYKKGKEKRQDDEDVDDIGRLVDEIVMDANQPSTPTRRDRTSKLSPGKGMANRKQPDSPVRNRFNDKLSTLKIMEAKETAKAELEIAFEMLDMMKERGLRADPEAYQCLIDACGRCGDTDRATQLLVRMHEDGIVADGVVYSSLVSAFSTDNAWKQASGEVREELPDWANGASIDMDWNSLKVQKRSYIDIVKEKLVDENGDHPAVLNKFKRFVNRNMSHQNKDASSSSNNKYINKSKANGYTEQYVTDHVLRQIVLGENLLEVVYPDISIDTDNEFCPRCNYYLSDDDVVNGWVAGNAQEYKTECPNCLTKFVPHFCVQSTLPSFVGSRGPSSALFCERLSPWVLKKELRSVISGGIDDLLSPEWREKESKNAVLYWNLILSFMRYRFPFTFLLQGSFSSSLIAPTPDTNDVEVGL
jgi:pentatricopeptide repeat protein